ncbi:MAG: GntR family transcriptional regulator [Spirochaetes bacterium]|nr:GntR family transcriptional regulator [Spirochaetota bacterium]
MDDQTDIKRRGFIPAYMQLVNILKEQIADGVYLPGDRLPSESELCKKYRVSPMTVRRSINVLIDHRIVNTIQGSGTYVKGPDLNGLTFSMDEFNTIFTDRGNTKVKIIDALIIKSDERAAKKLQIEPGAKTILIKRVLINRGDPIIFHKEQLVYDPKSPVIEAELEVTSLHGLFVGTGESRLRKGNLVIEAAVLSKEEAEVLNTVPMSPAFCIEHIFFDFNDKPVSWGQFLCRGDRFKFKTTAGVSSN